MVRTRARILAMILLLGTVSMAEDAGKWKPTDFIGKGEVKFEKDVVYLCKGDDLTGVNYTGPFPRVNYEITVDAKRVEGDDFFCGLTFPYKDTCCSFIVGGWGGKVIGLSCLDYNDAYNNETCRFRTFEKDRWYQIKVRVTDKKIKAWVDGDQLVEVEPGDRHVSVRIEVEQSQPLGIATWRTTGAFRNFKVTEITDEK